PQIQTTPQNYLSNYYGDAKDVQSHKLYVPAESPHDLLQGYKFLTKELQRLNEEVRNLRREVRGVTEESSMWTLKYSRRIVMVSNLLFSVYILGKRGINLVNNINSRSMLLGLIFNPMNWFSTPKGPNKQPYKPSSRKQEPQLKFMLVRLLWKQVSMSGCLLISSYWLMSRDNYKRNCGIALTFITNIYMAFTTDVSSWTVYFNCFTLLMYITARYVRNKPILKIMRTNISRTLSLTAISSRDQSYEQDQQLEQESEEFEENSFSSFLQRNSQIRSSIDEWNDCKIQPEMITSRRRGSVTYHEKLKRQKRAPTELKLSFDEVLERATREATDSNVNYDED
ncbi:hypothetical protein AKO1_011177, partial [Acrasis kona]